MKRPKVFRDEEPAFSLPPTPAPVADDPPPSDDQPTAKIDVTTDLSTEITHDESADLSETAPIVPRASKKTVREAKRQVRAATKQRRRRERAERRRFTEHARARRRRNLIVLSALTLLALFVGAGLFTPVMSVRDIDVRGTSRVDAGAVEEALASLRGEPLALVSDERVFDALKQFSLIEHYSTEKIPPGTLRINVRERQPMMAVQSDAGFDLLDSSGVVIERVDAEHLPEHIPVMRGVPVNPESASFRAVSLALRNMPDDLKTQIAEVSAATPQHISLTLHSGVVVVWGDATNTKRKSLVFQSMVQALGDQSVSTIDVSSPNAPVFVP